MIPLKPSWRLCFVPVSQRRTQPQGCSTCLRTCTPFVLSPHCPEGLCGRGCDMSAGGLATECGQLSTCWVWGQQASVAAKPFSTVTAFTLPLLSPPVHFSACVTSLRLLIVRFPTEFADTRDSARKGDSGHFRLQKNVAKGPPLEGLPGGPMCAARGSGTTT